MAVDKTVLITGGGKYDFFNCTFANFNLPRFSRRTPQVLVSNYRVLDGTGLVYPTYTQFVNCIIWGSEEDEFVIDSLTQANIQNAIAKLDESANVLRELQSGWESIRPSAVQEFNKQNLMPV